MAGCRRNPHPNPAGHHWLAITAAAALLVTGGCQLSAGPATLRIVTEGQVYDDFVIVPIQEYGLLHSSQMLPMEPIVVSSENELTIPEFATRWNFSTLLVSVYHPEFVYAWTGDADNSDPALALSPVQPQSWQDYVAARGPVSLQRVADHLAGLAEYYVTAFPAGEQRRRLRQYLPGLHELVEKATWLDADVRRWGSESTARAELANSLDRLAALMQ